MIASYSARLAILCLASFFLIHLVLGLLSLGLSSWLTRASRSMRPYWVSKISIALRLTPACLSILIVMVVCVPSYLRYEGNVATEEIGLLCLVPACLGFIICLIAITKAAYAMVRSTLLTQKLHITDDSGSWYLNKEVDELPPMGLVGLFKSRVVVSPSVLKTLTPEQFQAALDHEHAHRSSGDNLKRLLILLSPNLFPFIRSFRPLENLWERSAELSADDFATRGQPRRSIALAEALIKLARRETNEISHPLVSGLFAAPDGLAIRVERLLQPEPAAEIRLPSLRMLILPGLSVLLISNALALPQLHLFQSVYALLESLLR
jgi:beta-lactamase regulating signal transducer with metallopeptidase domain